MNVKTMEGLVGARTNMNLRNTPMRVYREARQKGDMEAMERAMGYAGEYSAKAEEYKAEADEGIKEDAEKTRKIAEEQREAAVQKRREERENLEGKMQENSNADTYTDILEISEEGKMLLKDNTDSDNAAPDETKLRALKEPVTYTETGEMVLTEQSAGIAVSV